VQEKKVIKEECSLKYKWSLSSSNPYGVIRVSSAGDQMGVNVETSVEDGEGRGVRKYLEGDN
jgi:hypothetical protein